MLEAGHAIVFAGPRRQHDDRHVRHVGARSQDPADLEAAEDRQVEVEDDQIGRPLGDGLQRGVAGADDLGLGVAAALERVLDESGDVVLVFDDEDAVSWACASSASVPAGGFAIVSTLLNVG